ncbi:phosphatase-like [Marinobacterium lacunae]|uniref:Phosphatase-like n=1 Tax=Marinobacterium lacunae TaxID=1232683 RepID=A0A081FWW7_9GAMM|nr:alkaline phosphatase PhoX [Marinobacterium lacunae]KEA63022.1 phosphatase-like [Marinobacterium lacunae]
MSKKRIFAGAALALIGPFCTSALAGNDSTTGPFGFKPISGSAYNTTNDPQAPWLIPQGFEQYLVSGEKSDMWGGNGLNIYDDGEDDWHDMNTVNENGPHAGRFLFRTHEVRGHEDGGALSMVDLKTGQQIVLAQKADNPDTVGYDGYTALDGIRWTPWGTLLFAEETTGGRLFEVVFDYNDEGLPTQATIFDRPEVGRLAHEGIEVDEEGNIYVVDEYRGQRDGEGGGIYKFVPDTYGDLSSGNLYVLKVDSVDDEFLGQAEWAGPIDPMMARRDGTAVGGARYNRPEDLQIIGTTLYAAITEGTYTNGSQNYDGRVVAVNLDSMRVTDFVKPGVNVDVESGSATGFDNPDNLAKTPDGKLVIIEDNSPSDIWIAQPGRKGSGAADWVKLFASLTDDKAEGTGIYFGQDPDTLFVNIQHSKHEDGDGTWAIKKVSKGNKH